MFEKEFCPEKMLNDYKKSLFIDNERLKIMNKAIDLNNDLKYIVEHFERTRKSDFHLIPIPSLGSVIMDSFFRKIYSEYISWRKSDWQTIEEILYIYEISYKLMRKLNEPISSEIDDYNVENFKEVIKWEKVVKYYTGETLKNNMHCFFGCSTQITAISNEWDQVVNEIQ